MKEPILLHEHLVDQEWFNALLDSSLDCIITVADVVEAIRSARPYRNAKGIAAALDEINRWSGIKYDADVVAACRRLIVEQNFDMDDNDYTSTDFAELSFMKVKGALG